LLFAVIAHAPRRRSVRSGSAVAIEANFRATVLALDEVAPGYALAIEEGPAA
jgi:hypothetical protein